MMKAGIWKAVAAGALLLAVSACGDNANKGEPAAPAPAAQSRIEQNFDIQRMRGASLAIDGDELMIRRRGEGPVGITIKRVEGATAAATLNFAAAGEEVRIRVRQNGAQGYVDRARDNSIMVGPGGADELLVYTRNGERVRMTVQDIVDCASSTCTPATVRAE